MKVKDIMVRRVDYVSPSTSIRDVARLIFGRGLIGVPVARHKKVIGFITERDILARFFPTVNEHFEDPTNTSSFEKMEIKVADISEVFSLSAKDVMSKKVNTIKPDDHVLKAQSIMSLNKVSRLPVVDKDKKIIGIVAKNDIFRAFVGNRLELAENEEFNDFLALHYRHLFNWKKRLKKEIPSLQKVFRKHKVKKYLDIGAGTGDHVRELAAKGYIGYGFERSKLMFKQAQIAKESLPKKTQENIHFFSGEYIKELKKLNGETFDAAIFMGNSIAHNPGGFRDVVKATVDTLSDKAVIVFQLRNTDKYIKYTNRLASHTFLEGDSKTKEHAVIEFFDPPKDRRVKKTMAIFDSDGDTWTHYGTRTTNMAYVTQQKLKTLLRSLGFNNIETHGSSYDYKNWDHLFTKPFEISKSDWINIIATK